ncbi:MAG: OmpH family outer membrane protein [Nitrospinae bacterium]|nr:OmpH family outer membrane protein [Nitrospinota bacterium]
MSITHYGRIFTLLAVVLLLAVPSAARAADKIGGVNLQKVLDDSVAGKAAVLSLRGRAEKESNKLKAMQDEIEKLRKEIDQGKIMLRPDALQDKQNDLRRKEREFKLYQEDTRSSIQQEQGQTMRKILEDVMRIIKEYGKKNGFTLILEQGDSPAMGGPVVLYMDKTVDVTPQIISLYDAETKGKK